MVDDKNTEEKIQTDGVDCVIKRSKIASIPEEIVFNILLYLPADVIYDVMRYVCREWYNIIHSPIFISSHLQKSTSGLFVQRHFSPESGYFVKTTKSGVEVKQLAFQFAGDAVACCNGLVLLIEEKRRCTLYVANPVTKQQLALPPFLCADRAFHSGFAYAASSRVYKVVQYIGLNYGCAILTLGVDKAWRPIDSQLPSTTDRAFTYTPVSVGGFVHWACSYVPFVFSLDVETETFQQIPVPQGYENKSLTFAAMGSSLSFTMFREKYLWEVWVLTDPQSGEWEKLPDINFQGQIYTLEDWYCPPESVIYPVGWLQSRELMVFCVSIASRIWIVYNVKTGGIHLYEVDNSNLLEHQKFYGFYNLFAFNAHVNSLVPLNGFLMR